MVTLKTCRVDEIINFKIVNNGGSPSFFQLMFVWARVVDIASLRY